MMKKKIKNFIKIFFNPYNYTKIMTLFLILLSIIYTFSALSKAYEDYMLGEVVMCQIT